MLYAKSKISMHKCEDWFHSTLWIQRRIKMKERYRTLSAVILMLTRENNGKEEILLQKRKNTGYMDGYWDCSASRTC